jgi:hemolysin activation/secretion protein
MGGVVKSEVLAVHIDGDEVRILARRAADDSVAVEYMEHVLHTSHFAVKRIELEGNRLRVVERRLEYTALECDVYAVAKTYVDKTLSEKDAKELYDTLATFIKYPGDFMHIFNALTAKKEK